MGVAGAVYASRVPLASSQGRSRLRQRRSACVCGLWTRSHLRRRQTRPGMSGLADEFDAVNGTFVVAVRRRPLLVYQASIE